ISAAAVVVVAVVIWMRRELYRWAVMASRSLYHLWDLKGPTNYPIVGSVYDFRWNVFDATYQIQEKIRA
ncbi:hypothetical protein PRIPAC_81320, partial [Pristionchus pacificus]